MKKIILALILVSVIIIPVLGVNSADKIAYERGGIIFLVNADGTNEVRLTEGNNPVWSPDGKKIMFTSKRRLATEFGGSNVNVDISVINADGSGEITILKDILMNNDIDLELSYSPDGKIAFAYKRICKDSLECDTLGSATEDYKKTEENWLVYRDIIHPSGHIGIIDDNGENFIHLTDFSDVIFIDYEKGGPYVERPGICTIPGEGSNNPMVCISGEGSPLFSPDGKKILYSGSDGSIMLKNSDGSNPVTILNKKDASSTLHGKKFDVWSPDGKSILLHDSTHIYKMQIDGLGLMKLTEGYNPKFSPDGKNIAYLNIHDELWKMNIDGTGQQELLNSAQSFDWSPDSKKIVATKRFFSDVYVMNSTGIGGANVIIRGGEYPKWSPASNSQTNFLPVSGNSGQTTGDSKQLTGFGAIMAINGLIISLIGYSIYFKKHR